ncbi:MAG TPA: transporter [Desulfocapsa sulfexigens]|nr:transporter [Desulfocapsa sulfexigens]
MKKRISVLVLSSIVIAGSAWASGFRIPEQSVDSVAKAGANVASATNASTSYYNPAKMVQTKDAWQFEGALTYINLPAISYDDNRTPLFNGESKAENFLLPTFFFVSPDMNNFRFGLSATAPFGLSKRWEQPFPRSTAQEYSLHVYEINPTVAYKTCDYLSLAGGVRLLYASADVSSLAIRSDGLMASRYMDGDAYEFGWNLAANVRPAKDVNIAITYRSNVDMDLDGDVTLATNTPASFEMNTGGNVTLPAPAVLSVSLAYTFGPATIDFTWDRTFWSEYESIDFHYDNPVLHPVLQVFTASIPKNWDDTSGYRIGLDYVLNDSVTLMAGFAYDESPIPEDTLGFELPGSDAWLYSLGFSYKVNEKIEIGLAYLYDYKEDRTVTNSTINGEFTDAAAHLVSAGLKYDF